MPSTATKTRQNGTAPSSNGHARPGEPAPFMSVAQCLDTYLTPMDPALRERTRAKVSALLLDSNADEMFALAAALHEAGRITPEAWRAADEFVGKALNYSTSKPAENPPA